MLAGLAGLTLAAGLAGLYLWQERRLKQRDAGLLRLKLPPLESLDRLSARTAFVSLVVLSTGIVVGLGSFSSGRLRRADGRDARDLGADGGRPDPAARARSSRPPLRRPARCRVFLLVVAVLPLTHFAS